MQNQVVAIALVLALVIGASLGYLGGAAGSIHSTELRTTTVTTTSTITMTTISTASNTNVVTTTNTVLGRPSGPYATMITEDSLRMELTLNSSRVPLGGAVQIKINLTNVLNTHSLVPTSSAWTIDGLIWPPNICLSQYVYPVGLALFAGYYVAGNLSAGKPLYFERPGTIMCPNTPGFSSYTFDPTSNVAILTDAPGSMIRVYSSTVINGSWACHDILCTNPTFSQFSPRVYTVVEGDQWGDTLFLYFRVG